MIIQPRPDGLITVEQAAALARVNPPAIRHWINRGYLSRDGSTRRYLPVVRREGRQILLDPIDVAKAEHATRDRARRVTGFQLAAVA